MKIKASLTSKLNHHITFVTTDDKTQEIKIRPKSTGFGSAVNGGELLLLSIATCFCNDLYREAKKREIAIDSIEIECSGEFGAEGEPGFNFQYKADVTSEASPAAIAELLTHTDKVSEIHNTLRKGIKVTLNS